MDLVFRRLVDKVDRLKRTSVGDGVNDCLVCGTEFGVFGTRNHAAVCQDCRKVIEPIEEVSEIINSN